MRCVFVQTVLEDTGRRIVEHVRHHSGVTVEGLSYWLGVPRKQIERTVQGLARAGAIMVKGARNTMRCYPVLEPVAPGISGIDAAMVLIEEAEQDLDRAEHELLAIMRKERSTATGSVDSLAMEGRKAEAYCDVD